MAITTIFRVVSKEELFCADFFYHAAQDDRGLPALNELVSIIFDGLLSELLSLIEYAVRYDATCVFFSRAISSMWCPTD